MPNPSVVFIGGPFKALIDPVTGLLGGVYRERYQRLISFFEKQGWTTLNAHREEGWGAGLVSDEECTARDLRWMRACDLFVAFPGAPASPGTHVEIGWASALRRPTVLLLESQASYAALVTGLGNVAPVTHIAYAEGSEFWPSLSRAIDALAVCSGVHISLPIQ